MPVRLLTGADVSRLLTMEACIAVMADVLAALSRGEAMQPLRTVLRLPGDRGAFGVMPAQVSHPDAFGLKVISVFPGNEGTRFDSHQGAVLLFEPRHGTLAAIMDAAAMTAIRTAAVSAVATRLLARPDAGDLALLGTGVQARTHLEAMRAVRPLRRVRAWSRHEAHRRAFADWAGQRHGIEVETPGTAREAVEGADLICTVTASRTPVLIGAWIAPGAHVNAVGASLPDARELDTAAVVRARLFVDRRESAFSEAGDFLIPRAEGAISDEHLRGELGDLLVGRLVGREDETQVTLFKSLGLAVEDVAAAHVVHGEAERRNVGTLIELGGLREQAG
ncbi:MAG TPA: ornithine cyclodeaminase family protein [Gemmatimonadales bacterium]